MNTVFLVKNASYRFLTPPAVINKEWLYKILGTNKINIKPINKNICIIHNGQGKKYKLTFDQKLTTLVPSCFIIAQKKNNQFIPLNEHQEDYIIDTINIKTYK